MNSEKDRNTRTDDPAREHAKKGKWLHEIIVGIPEWDICSVCGHSYRHSADNRYCGHCGARME